MAIWGYAIIWFRFQRPLVSFLQGVYIQLGEVRFSLYYMQRAFFLLLALYWVSKTLRDIFEFWLT